MYGCDFVNVGDDILRQGASSSRIEVRAVKQTFSILFVVIDVSFEFCDVRTASLCLLIVTRNVYLVFHVVMVLKFWKTSACVYRAPPVFWS